MAASLHYNRLPYFSMLANLGRQFSREQRDFLQAHGVIGEALTSTLNRWTGDHMTHSLTGRVAGSVMKLSLMNAWTDGLRGAFAATMMQGFTKKLGKAWGQLDAWDQWLMQRKGIGEAEWAVISRAAPTERNGMQYLTADSIRATGDPLAGQAATKWLGLRHRRGSVRGREPRSLRRGQSSPAAACRPARCAARPCARSCSSRASRSRC